jgi:hypothetical protein
MGFGPQTGQLFGARMSDPEHIEILRRGPRAWNALDDVALPLGERQLGPINGGPINLRSASMQRAFLRSATLTGADLEAVDLNRSQPCCPAGPSHGLELKPLSAPKPWFRAVWRTSGKLGFFQPSRAGEMGFPQPWAFRSSGNRRTFPYWTSSFFWGRNVQQ